jgi:hypothetical protein
MPTAAMMSGSTPEQLAGMLARIALEPNDGRAAALAEQYAAAFSDAVVDAWGRRLDAAAALLDEAERLLDRAALAAGDERERLVALADVFMDSARARP